MQRYLFKVIIYLLIIAGLANYFIYFTTGKVPFRDLWKSTQNLSNNIPTPSLPNFNTSLPKLPGINNSADRAYKWTDENGVTHFSDQAPDGQDAKLIQIEPQQTPPEESSTADSSKNTKNLIPTTGGEIDLNAIKQQLQDAQKSRDAALKQ